MLTIDDIIEYFNIDQKEISKDTNNIYKDILYNIFGLSYDKYYIIEENIIKKDTFLDSILNCLNNEYQFLNYNDKELYIRELKKKLYYDRSKKYIKNIKKQDFYKLLLNEKLYIDNNNIIINNIINYLDINILLFNNNSNYEKLLLSQIDISRDKPTLILINNNNKYKPIINNIDHLGIFNYNDIKWLYEKYNI